MKNLIILEIKATLGVRDLTIYPVILLEGKEMILVDTGLPGQIELIESEARSKGVNLEELTKIVITHQDIDHIGSLADIKTKYKNVQILSSEIEADYISGKKKPLRLERMMKNYNELPEEQKERARTIQKLFENLKRINIDLFLKDNELLPGCKGIRAIETPGHLPGHYSIYSEEAKTLITGDAIGLEAGKIFINQQNAFDINMARESIKKMLNYDIEHIVCYHGGLFEDNCMDALRNLSLV